MKELNNPIDKQKEWLISNGLGGYASSSTCGLNTRKYHGLLIAAMNPPVDRRVLLSSLDEEIILENEIHHLAVHRYPGTFYPEGYKYLQDFSMEELPLFQYNVADIDIKKRIMMVHGENTTIMQYKINNPSDKEFIFKVLPLVNNRSIHHLTNADSVNINQESGEYYVKLHLDGLQFYLSSNMQYNTESHWYYDIEYDIERERGYPYREDNLNPGYFQVTCKGRDLEFFIITSTEGKNKMDIADVKELFKNELLRRKELTITANKEDEIYRRLLLAADSFFVKRNSTGSTSIIAGYHWFADWGRDAMIALPGLTLVNGRYDIAKEILSTFATHCQRGIIPNMFAEFPGQSPVYNTVDASLWFIHALGKYFDYTNDTDLVEHIWNTVEEIIYYYSSGTDYNIKMDQDGLISHTGQLTWMDAKIGDFEVTPRAGKTCEINALWYNALRYTEYMGNVLGKDTKKFKKIADDLKMNFADIFWNEENNCLFDYVMDPESSENNSIEKKDAAIRPNQILAISLPYSMLSESMSLSIIEVIERELLTPYGLRTLSKSDKGYIGIYQGNDISRDFAYHNGTVWTWLLGHYITAYRKTHKDTQNCSDYLKELIKQLEVHLDEAGIGTISEIFDGDKPHEPKGCISQAWSVGEIIRSYVEDILQEGKVPIRNL